MSVTSEQELLTLPEHLRSPPVCSGVRAIFSFMCMFSRSLFVLLSFFSWSLCCLFFRFTDSDYPIGTLYLQTLDVNFLFIIWFISLLSLLDINVQLLYTTTTDIVLLDTDTGVTTTISEGNSYAWYIDYHYTADYIYWSDRNTGTISRYISVVSLLLFTA
jgi:hypothetical protein